MNIFTERCRPDLNVYCVVAVAVVSGGNHYILDRKKWDGISDNRDEYLNCDDENDLKISVMDSDSKETGIKTVRKSQEKILLKSLKYVQT